MARKLFKRDVMYREEDKIEEAFQASEAGSNPAGRTSLCSIRLATLVSESAVPLHHQASL